VKLFFHYCSFGFSNCYILGTEKDDFREKAAVQEAIIIDPGNIDQPVLEFIEKYEYKLLGVLLTHDHLNHTHGLRTLKRIYNADIYAVNHIVMEHKTNMVKDGDNLSIGSFPVEVISIPGHSSDSAVYKIRQMLFTGDALCAGLVGTTASSYGAEIQVNAIRSKILSLPGNHIIFPGHGPPSTLEAERRFNAGIQIFEQNKKKRPPFSLAAWLDD
jgi:glyoxylase-like metal-dependent hydrolase (beta-lactamase superfamily II)